MFQTGEKNRLAYPSSDTASTYEDLLVGERPRLVRLCAYLTGDSHIAEDLAQETLLEAWRNQHKLHDQHDAESRTKWLSAIARNVCMRWTRRHSRDLTYLTHLVQRYENETELSLEDMAADDYDVEVELEREELADLLDRALALLPPSTREVLIARYIHESPHAEIAQRLGLNEDALVQRLYRGKLALRRVIATHMSEEAEAYGICMPASDKESLDQETRIWCPLCSKGRLIKYYDASMHRTGFTCPKCWHIATTMPNSQVSNGIRNPKSILTHQIAALGAFYWEAIKMGQVACPECGLPSHTMIYRPQDSVPERYLPSIAEYHELFIQCSACDYEDLNAIPHLILDLPEVRPFWRKHPRMQWRPGSEIESNGQPARTCSFQSVTDSAHLDVIYNSDTLNVLGIHEGC